MKSTENALNWFEIPVADIVRAKRFYEKIFDIQMLDFETGNIKMAVFPTDNMSGKVGGGLAQSNMHKPGPDGAIIYLNGNPDLSVMLGRVEGAGGKVIMPKTQVSEEIGYMAFFSDTEGNQIALHSGE